MDNRILGTFLRAIFAGMRMIGRNKINPGHVFKHRKYRRPRYNEQGLCRLSWESGIKKRMRHMRRNPELYPA